MSFEEEHLTYEAGYASGVVFEEQRWKQRVKEAIIEECNVHCLECELPEEIRERLLKRLGL